MKVVTKTQTFTHAALFEVEVGTTGLCGGDTGHGGRTYLRFKDLGSTDMRVHVFSELDRVNVTSERGEVTLVFGGDAELSNLIAGLQFAVDVLKESEQQGTMADLPTVGTRTIDEG